MRASKRSSSVAAHAKTPAQVASKAEEVEREEEEEVRVMQVIPPTASFLSSSPPSLSSLSSSCQTNNLSMNQNSLSAGHASQSEETSRKRPRQENEASLKEMFAKRRRNDQRCAAPTRDRIRRALTQRLFLINFTRSGYGHSGIFTVLGSTGNVYEVKFAKEPSCSCPDSAKGNLCKHHLFVMLKVLRLERNNSWIWRRKFDQDEVHFILRKVPSHFDPSVVANRAVRNAVCREEDEGVDESKAPAKRQPIQDKSCPICFDDLEKSDTLSWCTWQCGMNFHKACIDKWLTQNSSCPNCRTAWLKPGTKAGKIVEGYKNFGDLQGQPRSDMSTSSWW